MKVISVSKKKLTPKKKKNGYWTYSLCLEAAKRFNTIADFQKQARGAYKEAHRQNFFAKITSHMQRRAAPAGFWKIKENVAREAGKYSSRSSFMRGKPAAYAAALNGGYLDEICSHMKRLHKPNRYWNRETVLLEALKYKSRTDFNKNASRAFYWAHRLKIIDEACSHMDTGPNKKLRTIYVHIFRHKRTGKSFFYVGLTCNPTIRAKAHKNNVKSAIYTYLNNTKQYESIYKSNNKFFEPKAAREKEISLIRFYQSKGYHLLNRNAGGGLGARSLYWTEKLLKRESKKFRTKMEFIKGAPAAYATASRLGLIDTVCSHMSGRRKPYIVAELRDIARKYRSRSSFQLKSSGAYTAARRLGILDSICKHMTKVSRKKRQNGYWSQIKILSEAKNFQTIREFRLRRGGAYAAASRLGILPKLHRLLK